MQGVSGSSPLVSTKNKGDRTVAFIFVWGLTRTTSHYLPCQYFASQFCSEIQSFRAIVVRIRAPRVYCVIRRVRPTNSKIHLSSFDRTVAFIFVWGLTRTTSHYLPCQYFASQFCSEIQSFRAIVVRIRAPRVYCVIRRVRKAKQQNP